MPRATWSGSLAFGLVNVPVELFAATEDKSVRFRELEAATGERIRHRRVAERSEHEVTQRDIVKAYEVTPGEYVRVEADELAAVQPERSRTIEVEDFVELAEIDPLYYRRSYHLPPRESGRRAYWLLHRAMSDAGNVAIGRFVMRTKEYLVAVRPTETSLLLETLYFADEVRDTSGLDIGEPADPAERELTTALRLIDSLTTAWDPAAYADTYREQLLELIEQKAGGEEIVVEPEREPAPVRDLLAALQASVERAGGRAASERPLEALTRDELYERAAEAEVEGRSKMTKAQLVKALRKESFRRAS